MTAVIETAGLGKRYRRLWALADCTLSVPAGHVVGLVGPERSRQDHPAEPGHRDAGADRRHDRGARRPAAGGPAQLARVGYLAQNAPVYAGLSVAEHLRLGAHLNPGWDPGLARGRIERLDLDPGQKAGTLSGGQRAQLALTLAVAQAAGAADPGRAGGQPGPAGPARVPAGPDGSHRRAGTVGGAVLPPGRRSGASLRLPDRAGRLPGPAGRAGGGTAGLPPPAVRPAPRSRQPARQHAGHLGQPHRRAEHAAGAHRAARCSTRPGWSPRWPWRTWCWPT